MSEKQKITEEMGIHKEWMEKTKDITMEKLPEFLRHLQQDYEHDYGTICHAIAAAAIGTARAFDRGPQGGITGFQAGAIMWEMIRGWGVWPEGPKRMTNYHDMLFPQNKLYFTSITKETFKWLQEEAKKNMDEAASSQDPHVHVHVYEHWKSIAEGKVPFGYTITDEA